MWGRWYLPMFLLRDGLLTLMYNASFITLLRFWSSIPTMQKFSMVKMVIYWGGCLQVFFEPLSKCPWGLFLVTFHPVIFVSMYDSTFLLDGILMLGSHQEVLYGIAFFKVDLHSMFTACFLYALTNSFLMNLSRAIKEALYIRVNNPSLNRNIGKYHLPHIWDEVLLNTSELKLKKNWPCGYSICHLVITSTS